MIVSVVDLQYVLGRSVFVRLTYATFDQFGGNHVIISSIFGTQDGDYQSTIIIYRPLHSSDICSFRACSTNAQYSTTSPV